MLGAETSCPVLPFLGQMGMHRVMGYTLGFWDPDVVGDLVLPHHGTLVGLGPHGPLLLMALYRPPIDPLMSQVPEPTVGLVSRAGMMGMEMCRLKRRSQPRMAEGTRRMGRDGP